jgi:hypothetical protein
MELVHWFVVLITVLPDGHVSIGHGTLLDSFASRDACEAALLDEFGRGYSAGYVAVQTSNGLQLVLERNAGRDVMQCLSPWTLRDRD